MGEQRAAPSQLSVARLAGRMMRRGAWNEVVTSSVSSRRCFHHSTNRTRHVHAAAGTSEPKLRANVLARQRTARRQIRAPDAIRASRSPLSRGHQREPLETPALTTLQTFEVRVFEDRCLHSVAVHGGLPSLVREHSCELRDDLVHLANGTEQGVGVP